MDDERLILEFLQGSREATSLIRSWIRTASLPYRERLAAEGEDLEQDVLLALAGSLAEGRFGSRSSLRTYVRSLVHHKCIDRIRASSRRTWVTLDEVDLVDHASSSAALQKTELRPLLLKILERMPESCRQLWRMLEAGMHYEEMSRELGISAGALRGRVFRCRQRALQLRQELESENLHNEPGTPTTK